jgi:hypothetical protein
VHTSLFVHPAIIAISSAVVIAVKSALVIPIMIANLAAISISVSVLVAVSVVITVCPIMIFDWLGRGQRGSARDQCRTDQQHS